MRRDGDRRSDQRANLQFEKPDANMGRGRLDKPASLRIKDIQLSSEDAAAQVNVSERSVETAKKVNRDCIDELSDAVSSGEVKVSDAVKAADLPEEEQKRDVEMVNKVSRQELDPVTSPATPEIQGKEIYSGTLRFRKMMPS